MSKKPRFGIVGLGNIGQVHLDGFAQCKNATLAAGCDSSAERLNRLPQGAAKFSDYEPMIQSGEIDAVLIATPHYQHVPMSITAMERGIHVLCEKPIAVSVSEARRLNAVAARHPKVKFGINYQQRTDAAYAKLRQLIQEGELGEISRITWIVTDWFRTNAYYGSGGWRATWKGEGGGVLINQCPHNLDLLQWITGLMPSRITAVGFIGKTHPIEVEDEISAILEYPNGAIGHFMTTTGEAPGTNRLEIAGDRGKFVLEGGKLRFTRTTRSISELNRTTNESFPTIECWEIDIPVAGKPNDRVALLQNFINHIVDDAPLLAPGVEGVRGLEIGNAMVMSALTGQPVELPVNGEEYDAFLLEMDRQYSGRKILKTREALVDMQASARR